MPPPGGGTKKKKKGRAPKHQNSFAFRHNPKSKKTDKILSSPNVGVCRRCYDKIEWRKKYRKYKPRTQPGKCNQCFQKNILTAYHTICTNCAGSDKAIAAMEAKRKNSSSSTTKSTKEESEPVGDDAEASSNDPIENNEAGATESSVVNTTTNAAATTKSTSSSSSSKRRIRVCAICTHEPAMSKYANASPEDIDLVEQLHEWEDVLDSGNDKTDGHKLTLREIKAVERKVEKLQMELKQRQKDRKDAAAAAAKEKEEEEGREENDAEEGGPSDDDEGSDDESVEGDGHGDPCEEFEAKDPFLLATGGKALVGDAYQQMLLAREQQKA
eukprot:CAMPEP_0183759690 /NCGR_PEP_ID=MMETSP0739-20130205/7237_1 /TAXON_ID=385413 /ORGANISM="Thalassiosira miniscula, Strain CCMP1093" /LENGTH=327 /DNA_ID=CAMNT_0025997509 /DNA_START=78 /DNA_END=1061 /DNA_ORIENTATION=+